VEIQIGGYFVEAVNELGLHDDDFRSGATNRMEK
jgi:hypothetical protein